MKTITLNPGAQKTFVNNTHRASAYIGGLGSGKTFAGIARALKFSQQPKVAGSIHGPRGCIAAISYPVLADVVYPQFEDMVHDTGLLVEFQKSQKRAILKSNCGCPEDKKPRDRNNLGCGHTSVILFRSLDKPNWMRGLELAYFFIDEGRHLNVDAWKVLYGRLRQRGYEHAGWVCSTPNGFDWMWEKFHPDSPLQLEGAQWYGASTMDNEQYLDPEYIKSLFAEHSGASLRQEVYGEFIGVTEGAVFYAFDPRICITDVPFDPSLELYSMWDFGIGDLNVITFGQVDWKEKELMDGQRKLGTEWVPVARLLGSLEGTGVTSKLWAYQFGKYCDEHFDGRRPKLNVGDPAGRQRNGVTATSVVEDLAQHHVIITTAPRKPQDYAIRILNNMMERNGVLVDRTEGGRMGAAISSHKWPIDANGNRTPSIKAVHDWTSHYIDGLRYWATVLFTVYPRRDKEPLAEPPGPGTVGHLVEQITAPVESWLGPVRPKVIDWEPGVITPRRDGRNVIAAQES